MKTTIIADSTQIDAFLRCETLWLYGHKLRLTSTETEANDAMLQGTYGHHLLDNFYKELANGSSRSDSLNFALTATIPTLCECGHKEAEHTSLKQIPLDYCKNSCVCRKFKATPFALDPVLMHAVRERVKLYVMTYSNGNDFSLEKPEYAEVGFSFDLLHNDEYRFILEGRIDLYKARLNGIECIADHKFQTRRHTLYKKSVQFRNYALVGNTKLFVVNYIRLAKTVDKDTFQRDVAAFTEDEHRWWKNELIKIFKRMAECTKKDSYAQCWSSCAGSYGYPCYYTNLCEERDKQMQEIKINQLYHIKEEWKPW